MSIFNNPKLYIYFIICVYLKLTDSKSCEFHMCQETCQQKFEEWQNYKIFDLRIKKKNHCDP